MIKLDWTSAKSSATFQVTDEEPVVLGGYAHAGKPILPQRVHVSWLWTDGAWVLYQVKVTGPVLKKDGTPGQAVVTKTAFHTMTTKWTADTPAWLRDAVEAHDPGGE